ncbi:unnamed protein product [Commensalibacter communis]|nr:unnamed protein product [Commensalibacter communis]CAI3949165.1 unnamed protein product [Commensalibacter communis]
MEISQPNHVMVNGAYGEMELLGITGNHDIYDYRLFKTYQKVRLCTAVASKK